MFTTAVRKPYVLPQGLDSNLRTFRSQSPVVKVVLIFSCTVHRSLEYVHDSENRTCRWTSSHQFPTCLRRLHTGPLYIQQLRHTVLYVGLCVVMHQYCEPTAVFSTQYNYIVKQQTYVNLKLYGNNSAKVDCSIHNYALNDDEISKGHITYCFLWRWGLI